MVLVSALGYGSSPTSAAAYLTFSEIIQLKNCAKMWLHIQLLWTHYIQLENVLSDVVWPRIAFVPFNGISNAKTLKFSSSQRSEERERERNKEIERLRKRERKKVTYKSYFCNICIMGLLAKRDLMLTYSLHLNSENFHSLWTHNQVTRIKFVFPRTHKLELIT